VVTLQVCFSLDFSASQAARDPEELPNFIEKQKTVKEGNSYLGKILQSEIICQWSF
jgi:hypothetical protein